MVQTGVPQSVRQCWVVAKSEIRTRVCRVPWYFLDSHRQQASVNVPMSPKELRNSENEGHKFPRVALHKITIFSSSLQLVVLSYVVTKPVLVVSVLTLWLSSCLRVPMEGGARVERSAALRPSRKLFTLPRAVPPTGATTWVGIALVSLCLLYQLQPFVSVRVDVVWLPSSHTSQPGVPATGSADVMGTGQVAAPPSSQSHRAARVSAETRAAPARDAPAASAHVVGTPSQELTPQPPTHSTTPQGVVSQAATPPVEHGAVPEARSAVAQPTQGLLSPAHNVRVDWPFGGPSQLVLTSDQIVAQVSVPDALQQHPLCVCAWLTSAT